MISTSQYGLVLRSPDRSFIVNSGITAQFYSHTILLSVPVQFYKVSYEQGAIDSFFLLVSMENRTDQLGSKKKPVV